jgi:hypothetical protein
MYAWKFWEKKQKIWLNELPSNKSQYHGHIEKLFSTISDSIDNPTILLIWSTLAPLFQTHLVTQSPTFPTYSTHI